MLFTLALSLVAVGVATAQDIATGSESGLLAYTTSVGPCTTNTIPESEIVFSIQTDTVVETPGPQSACTYLVNADNPTQIVSTLTPASAIPTVTTASESLILISGTGPTGSTSSVATTSIVVTTESGSERSSTATVTTEAADLQTSQTPSASTTADGAAVANGVAGLWFGAAGAAAVVAGLL